MATWDAAYELLPANTDNLADGDDAIRGVKTAIEERAKNDHTTYSGDSTTGTNTKDWLHKGGSAVGLLQAAAPTTRLSGEALGTTARDKGYIWFDDDNDDCMYIWTGAAFGPPGLIIPSRNGSDPSGVGIPVTGQMWLRTDV